MYKNLTYNIKKIRLGNLFFASKYKSKAVETRLSLQIMDQYRKCVVDLEPIILSEKRLETLGFLKDHSGQQWIDFETHRLTLIYSDGFWYPEYCELPEMSFDQDQCVHTNRIQYVHELQNLVFALRGEELKS